MSDLDNFYKQNAQCWRCRMYVPRVEMKYYAGLLYCPMCYQDIAEGGGRCQLCGKQLETGEQQLCHACKEKKRVERERKDEARAAERCERCGARLERGICQNCSRGDGEGGQVVRCSKCGGKAIPIVWHGGEPLCLGCYERSKERLRSRLVGGVVQFFRDLVGR